MESWRVSGRIGVMLFLSKVLAVYFEGACPHFWSCFLFSRVFVSPIPGISGRRQAPGMSKSFRAQTLHPVDPLETSKLKSSKQTLSHKSILIYLIYFEGYTSIWFLKLRSNWHTGLQNWAKFDSDISYHGFFTIGFVQNSFNQNLSILIFFLHRKLFYINLSHHYPIAIDCTFLRGHCNHISIPKWKCSSILQANSIRAKNCPVNASKRVARKLQAEDTKDK